MNNETNLQDLINELFRITAVQNRSNRTRNTGYNFAPTYVHSTKSKIVCPSFQRNKKFNTKTWDGRELRSA